VGFVPSVAVSWIGFLLFCITANLTAWPTMHRAFMPTLLWAVMILWIAPGVAAVGLGVMVRVSIRVNNTQEAQQLGGAVVRNRVRRRLKEAYRVNEGRFLPGYDLVVVGRTRAVRACYQEIERHLLQTADKLGLLKKAEDGK